MTDPHAYLLTGPRSDVVHLAVPEVPTAVVRAEAYPVAELSTLFDRGFSGMFPALGERGIVPVAPAYSLYTRQPTDTADIEVGVPIAQPLAEGFAIAGGLRVEPSSLPAGDVASVSYIGGYEGMSEAWQQFIGGVRAAQREPGLPFWEVYVSEPGPDSNPAQLRSDLYIRLA